MNFWNLSWPAACVLVFAPLMALLGLAACINAVSSLAPYRKWTTVAAGRLNNLTTRVDLLEKTP